MKTEREIARLVEVQDTIDLQIITSSSLREIFEREFVTSNDFLHAKQIEVRGLVSLVFDILHETMCTENTHPVLDYPDSSNASGFVRSFVRVFSINQLKVISKNMDNSSFFHQIHYRLLFLPLSMILYRPF